MASQRYIPGLDGIRAMAVMAVLAYHVYAPYCTGGFLGVDIFFVLSGFLITSLLIEQWSKTGTINFKAFWLARIRRLLPALYLLILAVVLATFFFFNDLLTKVGEYALSSLVYINNWWWIENPLPEAETGGRKFFLKHLWSLAIEEQFYLIWPPAVYLMLKNFKEKSWIYIAITIGIIVSFLEMSYLYGNYGTLRPYFGTDSRAFVLLIGCLLAFFMHQPSKEEDHFLKIPGSEITNIFSVHNLIGLMTLVVFFAFVAKTDDQDPFMYNGGLLLVSINAMIMIAITIQPGTILSTIFSFEPLIWIGKRSYGIYLWHYPLIIMTNPEGQGHIFSFWRALAQILATFVIAALSYRYLEMPIRRLKLKSRS